MTNNEKTNLATAVSMRWEQQRISRPGTTRDALVVLASTVEGLLPQELGSLLLLSDGMDSGAMDENMIRFWPTHEIQLATEALPDCDANAYRKVLVFADFLLWAHAYGVEISSNAVGGRVGIVGGAAPIWIASSFSAFLEKYLWTPDELFEHVS